MIGVVADANDLDIAREFFELFKTPWEPVVPGKEYAAVLTTNGRIDHSQARVIVAYGAGEHPFDREAGVSTEHRHAFAIDWEGQQIPIYQGATLFRGAHNGAASPSASVRYARQLGTRVVWRVGYDLFREVRHLLTEGQPAAHALMPTLELHIAALRQVLLSAGVSFLEVPPVPKGHAYICCLTHDVDFFGVRRHIFDRTLAGFVVRASFGTLAQLLRGERSLAEAITNWKALCSLPLILLGVSRDFWTPFEDYLRAEPPEQSTFFMVPFKDRPGLAPDGGVDHARAVRYQLDEVPREIREAAGRGSELGIHGIDAWHDADAGRLELARLASVTEQKTAGIRMHWLYFASTSPKHLESAGFDYDSTWGYNDAIGYRAGTSQVFRFVGTQWLLELPLSIMDSALLSGGRMALTPVAALDRCKVILENACKFGGTVVVNWHCRSLAPERLWNEPYRRLLDRLREGAWFVRASEAVTWFRWRRSITFTASPDARSVRIDAAERCPLGAGAVIRLYRPGQAIEETSFDGATAHVQVAH